MADQNATLGDQKGVPFVMIIAMRLAM